MADYEGVNVRITVEIEQPVSVSTGLMEEVGREEAIRRAAIRQFACSKGDRMAGESTPLRSEEVVNVEER